MSGSLSTAAAVVSLLVGSIAGPAPVGAAAVRTTCNLVPELRSVTINQGVGSYAVLARGKETLVRFFLSMPACAASGNTIALTGGTLTVKTGTVTLGTIAAPTPVPSATAPPLITPSGSAAAADSTADPKFVVPAGVLAPATISGRFTATFTGTINWTSQLSRSATPVTGSTTFSTLTGSTAPLTAQVEQRSNALRILVVPMGNGRLSFASEFPADATTAVQNAMATLSRTWPVPAGVADLGATSGGIRYTINPALLDVSTIAGALVPDANGALKFCGRTSNFDAFKGLLAQTLLTWNTANPTKTADVVMGAVYSGSSLGSNSGCAEGMASVNSPQAWIRAIPAATGAQSMSGALASMELAHTLGVVPTTRSGANDPYHSPNQTADGTAPGRGYNVSLRSYLADDRTTMLLSGTWNNDTTTFEPADFAMLLCRLGGQTTQDCATTGTTGTATGVGAGPRLVISGTTDLTLAGTHVVESYFSTDVAPGGADAASPLRLVQVNGSRTLSNVGLSLSAIDTDHDDAGLTTATNVRVFTASIPFDTGSTDVRLLNGTTVLYSRARGAPVPVSTTVTSVAGGARNLTNDPANDDSSPSLSPDGAWMAWVAPCQKPPQTACGSNGFVPRIYVAPVNDLSKTVEVPPVVPGDSRFYDDPALGPPDGTGGYPLAFQVNGDLYSMKLTPGTTPTFSGPVLVSAGVSFVSDPTWSPDGARIAFVDGGDIYIAANSAGAARTQLTTTGDASSPSWSRTSGDPRIVYVRSGPSEVGFAAGAQMSAVSPTVAAKAPASRSAKPARSVAPVPQLLTDVLIVNSSADTDDGVCDSDCTLADAIHVANDTGGATIHFAIPPTGSVATITTNGLPTISQSLVIDGTTQLGSGSAPGIELTGPGGGVALSLNGVAASEIRGLIVRGFTDAIDLTNSGGNTVAGNWLGLDKTGAAAPGNQNGVVVDGTDSNGNVIGGTTAADRNVMSKTGGGSTGVSIQAGATNTKVEGNYIGTDSTGMVALSSGGQNGIELEGAGAGNVIGGSAASMRNVISGNGNGVVVSSTTAANTVQGNWIGLKADGSAALPNSIYGVRVVGGSTSTTIVGNVVSGNGGNGIQIDSGSNTIRGNRVGTNPAGTAAIGNDRGIELNTGDNVVGGSGAGEGNLISGNGREGLYVNSNGNTIRGNRMGTNAAGTAAVGNGSFGLYMEALRTGNQIGGAAAGEGNLFSGQAPGGGMRIDGDSNTVRGNLVGTNAAGTAAIPNSDGIVVIGASNIVGGTSAGARNVVSGNTQSGILIANATAKSNSIIGNYIGVDSTGAAALGNVTGVLSQATGGGNSVGTASAGAGNVISGNSGAGVLLSQGTGGEIVAGNLIGTNADGTAAVANGEGVRISDSPNSQVGDGTSGGGNVVAGNAGIGIHVVASGSTGSVIRGNRVGVLADGTSALANLTGVTIESAAGGVTIGGTPAGDRNVVAHNTNAGIDVRSGTGTRIRGNSVFANGGLGIDLVGSLGVSPNDPGDPDLGSNNGQNFPLVTAIITGSPGTISGTLNSTASRTFEIDVFTTPSCDPSGNGEGTVYLGSATAVTDASGNGTFAFDSGVAVTTGFVTATATDTTTNDTSEFSPCFAAGAAPADVTIDATGSPDPVVSGEDLTQTIKVSNIGGQTATGVRVTTAVDGGARVVSSSGQSAACTTPPDSNDLDCPLDDIAAGGSRTITFIVRNNSLGTYNHTYTVEAAADADGENNTASTTGTVTSSCPTGFSCLWTIDPTAANPSTTRNLLVDDADAPAWGTDGRIAFEREDAFVSGSPQTQRIWTIPSGGPASSATAVTAGSFDRTPSMAGTTILVGRTVDTGPSTQDIDVFAIDLGAPKQVVESRFRAPAGFDPNLLRADLLLDCGVANNPIYVVAVGVVPSAVSADVATFSTAFDPGLSCAGGTILVVVTAGIDRSGLRAVGSTGTVLSADKPPVAAVSGPPLGSTRLQYNIIPLRGSGKDAEEGELIGGNLTWTLTGPSGPVTLATSTGTSIDVPVPPAGWAPGSYTARVTAHDSLATATATTTFTILGDADNDGLAAPFDKVSCASGAASLDNDPSNAFGDLDNDGIPNQADPEPCHAPDAATFAYTADTNFDPSTLNIPSTGNTVTVYVSIRGRDMRQIKPSTIRLDRIAGADPTSALDSPGCARFGSFVATAYTATAAQGVAKFDRQKLIGYLSCRHVMFRQIDLRIVGSSTGVTPAWRFTGIGMTNVMPG